jgi:hypothetical protein
MDDFVNLNSVGAKQEALLSTSHCLVGLALNSRSYFFSIAFLLPADRSRPRKQLPSLAQGLFWFTFYRRHPKYVSVLPRGHISTVESSKLGLVIRIKMMNFC